MKTYVTTLACLIFAPGMRAGDLSKAVEKGVENAMRRQDMIRDIETRGAQNLENEPALIRSLVEQESNPEFREIVRQKLNSAGPRHPVLGTYFDGEFKRKTPAQAVEMLRLQFAALEKWKPRRTVQNPIAGGGLVAQANNGLPPNQAIRPAAPKTAMQPSDLAQNAGRAESTQRAIALYPDAAVKDSLLNSRIREISIRLQKANDPILQSPSSPLVITQMAASELGILPKTQ